MAERYPVIIVGGGPVGVALAVDLALRGIPSALVERHQQIQRIPKGQGLTQRTLEHFYFWQCVKELRAARVMTQGYPIGGVTAYGDLMGEHWYAPPGREVVREFYFQDNERLPQYQTEQVLRAKLATLPLAKARFGAAARKIEQTATGVRVTVEDQGWPYEEHVLEGDYLVGCDGARSLVRESLGIDRDGSDFNQRMVLAVFRSKELHQGFERFGSRTTFRALHPDNRGAWMFFGRVDVGEGFFFHAPVPPDTTPDNYDFHALIQRAAGFKFAAEFDHIGFWDLKIAVATRYREGRAFIAGDAAHSHPPYGGHGLNSGLDDVANLGWKLAAALQGWGGEGLLDSYSTERRPVFAETGEDFIAARIRADAAFLEQYSPERDRAAFEAAWKALGEDDGFSQSAYEPHYEGSPVVFGPPDGKCSVHGVHRHTARPGHHLSPQPLSSGRNVYEELGKGFALLAFDAPAGAAAAFSAAAAAAGVPLKVIEDTRSGGRERYEAALVLVRPDQYVAWAGEASPADPGAVLLRATGRA